MRLEKGLHIFQKQLLSHPGAASGIAVPISVSTIPDTAQRQEWRV